MANNPIIHNDGGVFRFQDYLSQIPGFLKSEEDAVSILQILSDYINNAYRNISVIKKFEFKLITIESRVGYTVNKLTALSNLLKNAHNRSLPVLYMSSPISNPINSKNFFLGTFEYGGSLSELSGNVINIDKKDGDRAFIKFINVKHSNNTGVYVYNQSNNSLTLDPFGTSQDPFLNTPNEPIQTVGGLAPRIIEFMPSDISNVKTRKTQVVGNTIYFEVFFTATITDVKNLPSIYAIDSDIDEDGSIDHSYLVDYYDAVEILPSSYRYKYAVEFGNGCNTMDWVNIEEQGKGIFYSRDLTQYGKDTQIKVKDKNNTYIDPTFNENINELFLASISEDSSGTVTVKTLAPHGLDVGTDFNIENTVNFNDKDLTVNKIKNILEFTYENPTPVGVITENTGNMKLILTNLYYNRKNDHPDKFFLKVFYNNLEGTTEFQTSDFISRIKEREKFIKNIFDGSIVEVDSDWILADNGFFNPDWRQGDKVTLRRNVDSVDPVVFPTGLEEGKLYEISFFPQPDNAVPGTTPVKLKGVDITVTGSGKIDFVKLNVYFDAADDVNIAEDKIKLHHAFENDETNPVDPLEGLKVGDAFRLRGTRTGVIELPESLVEGDTYKILEIDTVEKTIKITSDNETSIDITDTGLGVIDFIKLEKINRDLGTVDSVEIDSPNSQGIIILKKYSGDFISTGEFAKLRIDGNIDFVAKFANSDYTNTTTVPWSNNGGNYIKNSHVTYKEVRYRLLNSVNTNGDSITPDLDSINYTRAMEDISIRDKIVENNPYMFGLYQVRPLKFGEEPNFEIGFGELSEDLYVRQIEDLELKYGHDQREWIFNPRFAPKNIVDRNGFLEIIKNEQNSDDVIESDVNPYVSAITSFGILLESLELKVQKTITSLEYDEEENIATVKIDGSITEGDHRLKTGVRVEIIADEPEYEGIFEIEVIDSKTFTYVPDATPTVSPATGTPEFIFNNTVDHEIQEISVYDGSNVKVITKSPDVGETPEHGFKNGNTVEITGATFAGYNGIFDDITVISPNVFTFKVFSTSGYPTESPTSALVSYQPIDGDYIDVRDQALTSTNGIYIAREGRWEQYDPSQILQNTVLFTRQNLFDVTNNNPEVAKGTEFVPHSMTRIGNEVFVTLFEIHDYEVGTPISIKNAAQTEYNGRFSVSEVVNEREFKYKIASDQTPATPAVPLQRRKIICQSDKWYKFHIKEIQWQKKSNINKLAYQVGEDNNEWTINPLSGSEFVNNVSLLSGQYTFNYETTSGTEKIKFKENDIVILKDQFIPSEGSELIPVKYRVKKRKWQLLDTKWVGKVRNIDVDYLDAPLSLSDDDPLLYRTYSDSEVNDYIVENFNGNLQLFKVDNLFASNYEFIYEKIENVDTAGSDHKFYDAKFDKNSVVLDRTRMKKSFIGVPDMKYPMVEKIERLAYLKDSSVIDFEFISHLAKYMGYDITFLLDDITESVYYKTKAEKELAVRKAIENLPQFYALKSTKGGLDSMLLIFGIVAKVVNLWTEANDPYGEFIPDYQIRNLQYTRMIDGESLNLVATPHFNLRVDIEGNFENHLVGDELERLKLNIKRYKPINTVFDEITPFLDATLSASIFMGEMSGQGCMQADIGFDNIEFDYGSIIGNDCF